MWPTPDNPEMKPFRNGQEAESGIIRRDPARSWGRRDDQGTGKEARGASPDGAAGDRQRDPAGAETLRKGPSATGSSKRDHQSDPRGRPGCAAEAETHSAPDLYQTERGTSRAPDW